jgi:hypothetical protein
VLRRCIAALQLQLVPDVALLDILANQCLARLAGFTVEQLASTLWALAALTYIPGTPLLEAAAAAMLANLALCAPKQAAQVCGFCTRVSSNTSARAWIFCLLLCAVDEHTSCVCAVLCCAVLCCAAS